MAAKAWLTLFMDAYHAWSTDKAPRLGAAVAYYSVFSLAPLLILAVAIAGLVFGERAAQGVLVDQLTDAVGRPQAEFLEAMIRSASASARSGILATVIALVTMLVGASGVFGSLQDALNTVWKVTPKPDRWLRDMIRDRLWSFVLVLVTGLLLLLLLAVSTALETVSALDFLNRTWARLGLPGEKYVWQIANLVISFGVVPGKIEGPTVNLRGERITSYALTNVRQAYGLDLEYLKDSDGDGFPDVIDPAPFKTGYRDGEK